MRKKIFVVVGARPNFVKSAPLMAELKKYPEEFDTVLIHTGQHYDKEMSDIFLTQLKMPEPDIYLGVGSDTHARQTAKIMVLLEEKIIEHKPDLVVVFGDVNSTLAAAVVTSKLMVKLAHVEAGLRSFDRSMPEEINRLVTDSLSDLLFVTEASGLKNLQHEGVQSDKIFFAGNIMIDSLIGNLKVARKSDILDSLSLKPGTYAVLTLHRPANVDNVKILSDLLGTLNKLSRKIPIIFPCHPRSKDKLMKFGLAAKADETALKIIQPLGYIEFLKLLCEAKFVLTDSGGIQEETTFLKIPCLTLRNNTERPITVEIGSNTITGTDSAKIFATANRVLKGQYKDGAIPELWDGKTSKRITDILKKI